MFDQKKSKNYVVVQLKKITRVFPENYLLIIFWLYKKNKRHFFPYWLFLTL